MEKHRQFAATSTQLLQIAFAYGGEKLCAHAYALPLGHYHELRGTVCPAVKRGQTAIWHTGSWPIMQTKYSADTGWLNSNAAKNGGMHLF